MPTNPLPANLRRIHKASKKSIRQACEEIGCSISMLQGWMQKDGNPTANTIRKLCEVYGVEPNDLLLSARERKK